ncbi:MAG: hypothetical protein LC800_15935 [Acidobacteria bacterium]|nr:hypothetical protein [Acidobacteriota bacterium]
MIPLHPTPEARFDCPHCRAPLAARGWIVPGMRNLAELGCASCGREFYGDMAAGQALYTPVLLDRASGEVHDPSGVGWFAEWLRRSYAERADAPLPFAAREHRPVTRGAVLLNCLDTLYGHSLLKLLNAQAYLDRGDTDVIVLVPAFLEWMVPDGVAQTWVVDLPLRRGAEWNDWLAREVRRRVEAFPAVRVSVAFSHPHPDDFSIERFTRVGPFPLAEWGARLGRPAVTFAWRGDRLWGDEEVPAGGPVEKIAHRLGRAANRGGGQLRKIVSTAEALRRERPSLDFAVAGIGEPGGLPAWVSDLRRSAPDERTERAWCERYAASHLVVGVHGSNMLLPSAHAGGAVELIGRGRQGNFLQDILFRPGDAREMFFRYRFVPHSTTPAELAELLGLLLGGYPDFVRLMGREFTRHGAGQNTSRWSGARKKD